MLDHDPFTFRVIDLKQYVYCPRIFYYQTVLPEVRPLTYKMEEGIAAHQQAEDNEKRRSLRTYGLEQGERHFNVNVYSPEWRLSGQIDMLIETDTELIPVDYKMTQKEGPHHRLQLMAYARLIEATWPTAAAKKVQRAFLYFIPTRQAISINLTPALRRQLNQALEAMVHIAYEQRQPEPTTVRGRCVDCEFRRFCNDVI
ncbi:MAG: CRISPR-associated protein Cas4 [Chloroflexi bacterium]|nr:CRISPR-associated protein Cas4 [Chloroflexota bacterium]MBP8059966.1 CRISPR-associated protein Cas4 [Chloroflexota bacterium]